MTALEEKKKYRWQMLRKFYEITDGQAGRHIISMWDVGKELGWGRETTTATYDYLQGERLLKGMTIGGGATITHEGVKEVEQAEDHPDQPTQHFPPNIIIYGNYTNGDVISVGQGNAFARNIDMNDVTFNQTWIQVSKSVDLEKLASELSILRQALKKEPSTDEHDVAIGNITSAEIEAKKGNGPKALEYLSKAGKWSLDVASKIGVSVAAEAIKESIGA